MVLTCKGCATLLLIEIYLNCHVGALITSWPISLFRGHARHGSPALHRSLSTVVESQRVLSAGVGGDEEGILNRDGRNTKIEDSSKELGSQFKAVGDGGRSATDVTEIIVEVSNADHNAPIDWVLSRRAPAKSRRYYRKVLQEGGVTVDGMVVKRFIRVKSGSSIVLKSKGNASVVAPIVLKPEPTNIVVHFEDEHYVAVNKPAGMVVQPCEAAKTGTVLHGLLHHMIKTNQVKKDDEVATQRLLQGIVHRLDKDTSGIMIVAKTLEASSRLSESFKRQKVRKGYLAICHGDPGRDSMVDAPMYRRSSGKMGAVWKEEAEQFKAKDAVTRVRNVATSRGVSLCEAEILTGRMHQVRVHLKFQGCPIVGDRVYGDHEANARVGKRSSHRISPPRPLLHAATLAFQHPFTGEELFFSTPMPRDMWLPAWDILRSSGTPEQRHRFQELQGEEGAICPPVGDKDRRMGGERGFGRGGRIGDRDLVRE
ncbi:unnamed protein product [Discosporangium mesarthrocarpum]